VPPVAWDKFAVNSCVEKLGTCERIVWLRPRARFEPFRRVKFMCSVAGPDPRPEGDRLGEVYSPHSLYTLYPVYHVAGWGTPGSLLGVPTEGLAGEMQFPLARAQLASLQSNEHRLLSVICNLAQGYRSRPMATSTITPRQRQQ